MTALEDDFLREMIVINLFRKNSKLPETIADISDRVKEIMFESKLNLDTDFFDKTNDMIDLVKEVKALLNIIDKKGEKEKIIQNIEQNPTFRKMQGKRKIDLFTKLQYEAEGVEGTDDFTPDAIDNRIRNGHRDALKAIQELKEEEAKIQRNK